VTLGNNHPSGSTNSRRPTLLLHPFARALRSKSDPTSLPNRNRNRHRVGGPVSPTCGEGNVGHNTGRCCGQFVWGYKKVKLRGLDGDDGEEGKQWLRIDASDRAALGDEHCIEDESKREYKKVQRYLNKEVAASMCGNFDSETWAWTLRYTQDAPQSAGSNSET